eukprot:COSAG06_NODE_44134_length_366_cov_0.434457_1_plen_32_part_10
MCLGPARRPGGCLCALGVVTRRLLLAGRRLLT